MDEDRVILKLLDHEERLERIEKNMATKTDISELLSGQDKMMQILLRVDQERVFTNEKIKQLEADVKLIKLQLQIA